MADSDPQPSTDGYTAGQLAVILGTTAERIRSFVRAGFLEPRRGPRGEFRFSFRDVILLRSAQGLARELPERKVRRALRRLKERLPNGRALTSLRIRAEGEDVVVQEGETAWQAESGQMLFDFKVGDLATKVAPLAAELGRHAQSEPSPRTAQQWHELGVELEACDPVEAARAYERALELSPMHADACINLGRLRHEAGELEGAGELYARALEARPGDPVALFNLGVVLEDLGDDEHAAVAYERAVQFDPAFADAHYNAARVYERIGQRAAAFRHLRVYRSLVRP